MKVTAAVAALATLPFINAAPGAPYGKGPKSGKGHGHGHGSKSDYPGLDVLAKRAGLLYFGTAIDNVVLDNEKYISIAHNKSEFGQVTPSNGQKWMYTEPQRNVFNFTNADAIIKPGKAADQIARCHAFVWHTQLPDWINNGNWTKSELIDVLENHIKHEANYYFDSCYAWDVVNEAFNDDGTYRETIFYKVIGKEYLELAFKFAKKYSSRRTKLYYNDYGIERINNKSRAVVELVKDFQARKIPIDGVGLQAHFTTGRAPSYNETLATHAMFAELGVETALTELDVRQTLPDSPEQQARQAVHYADAVRACKHSPECVGITVWDFWDPVSWVPETFPGMGDACLWSANFTRKPAYYAVSDALREE